jgi:hypothetical protein
VRGTPGVNAILQIYRLEVWSTWPLRVIVVPERIAYAQKRTNDHGNNYEQEQDEKHKHYHNDGHWTFSSLPRV